MRLRILIYYDGTIQRSVSAVEKIFYWLTKGLLELGHSVTIAAKKGSIVPIGCRLVELPAVVLEKENILRFFPENIDLYHFMQVIPDFLSLKISKPHLFSIFDYANEAQILPKNSIFLSQFHAQFHDAAAFVYPGIDIEQYHFKSDLHSNFFLYVTDEIESDEGLFLAMQQSKKAQAYLKIMGHCPSVYAYLKSFWSPYYDWIKQLDFSQRNKIFSQARALLVPYPSRFGCHLEVLEALACGTGIIARAQGCLPELISKQVGSLVFHPSEWRFLLQKQVSPWNPTDCRRWIQNHFHYKKMAQNYEIFYEKILNKEPLHLQFPTGKNWKKVVKNEHIIGV